MDINPAQKNLPILYFESDENISQIFGGEIMENMGLKLTTINNLSQVSSYLQENPATPAVILRNQTFGQPGQSGLDISPLLAQSEGFSGPVFILTAHLFPQMYNLINEDYLNSTRISLLETSPRQVYLSLLYIAVRIKFPRETEGFTREDLIGLLRLEIDGNSKRDDKDFEFDLSFKATEIVQSIMDENGSDESYKGLIEKINQWRQSKEGNPGKNKERL